MANKILVPLDGSDLAERALAYAERIAKATGWAVVLLQVVPARIPHYWAGLGQWDQSMVDRPELFRQGEGTAYETLRVEQLAAIDYLTALSGRLETAGLAVEPEGGFGDPVDTIVDRATREDVALVVMASHGRTGLQRLFRGSVASAVVGRTHQPVLVVRPFRDAEARTSLENAERLPAEQAEAVRSAIGAAGD